MKSLIDCWKAGIFVDLISDVGHNRITRSAS